MEQNFKYFKVRVSKCNCYKRSTFRSYNANFFLSIRYLKQNMSDSDNHSIPYQKLYTPFLKIWKKSFKKYSEKVPCSSGNHS